MTAEMRDRVGSSDDRLNLEDPCGRSRCFVDRRDFRQDRPEDVLIERDGDRPGPLPHGDPGRQLERRWRRNIGCRARGKERQENGNRQPLFRHRSSFVSAPEK
jgi:hypothetical protein